jgi:hypothetical protein
MLTEPIPIRRTDPATIYGINNLLIAGRTIRRNDLKRVRYTVSETEHPEATTQKPVPDYANVDVPVESCFFDELQTTKVFSDVGGAGHFGRDIQYNFALVVGPFARAANGETTVIYPFATPGKYYRVVVTFEFHNPAVAPFTHTEIIKSL